MNTSSKSVWRTALAYSTAILLACVLVASLARADSQVRSETVSFEDLDAGTPAGVQALYARIHAAAQRVCSEPDTRGAEACVTLSERRAIQQLNLPLLTAYYQRSALADASAEHVENGRATRSSGTLIRDPQ